MTENNLDKRIKPEEREPMIVLNEQGERGSLSLGDVFVSQDPSIVRGRKKVGDPGVIEVGVYTSIDGGEAADDKTRIEALYIVVDVQKEKQATMGTGGIDFGGGEALIRKVRARRLTPSRIYDPNGEIIEFFDGGDYVGALHYIWIVGKGT